MSENKKVDYYVVGISDGGWKLVDKMVSIEGVKDIVCKVGTDAVKVYAKSMKCRLEINMYVYFDEHDAEVFRVSANHVKYVCTIYKD